MIRYRLYLKQITKHISRTVEDACPYNGHTKLHIKTKNDVILSVAKRKLCEVELFSTEKSDWYGVPIGISLKSGEHPARTKRFVICNN